MGIAIAIFEFIVLIFSAVLHEVAHGFEAQRLGDDTAEKAGRLTLNPLKHLDPFLSVLMPLLLWLGTGFFFAGAKPVPYNPNKLKNPRTGSVKVAFAGPITNFAVALLFGLLSMLIPISAADKGNLWGAIAGSGAALPTAFASPFQELYFLFLVIVYINVLLGVFNLVPIPPLDGSKILFVILPPSERSYRVMFFLERWGLILVLIFVFFFYPLILPPIDGLFSLFTGHFAGL